MLGELLQTKYFAPRLRPSRVSRPRLIDTLNQGLHRKLTLISAPAGFGKTTLVTEWIAAGERPAAWLSLDESDSEPARFLLYLVIALQTVVPELGRSARAALESPQPPPPQSVLVPLLNEVAGLADPLMLVLDDYHEVDSRPVDEVLTFLLDNLPPQLHLVLTTREDPNLPLARLRARGELTEMRAVDLRFTHEESAEFLNQVMHLDLTPADIAALDARTEGWIAGLQMAALSMQGQPDAAEFIHSFTGSHRFVLDYLVEEVLNRQPADMQTFLLKTAVLDRLTSSLCEALTGGDQGQAILESFERANLFLNPLDNERRWYRYHHLFAELLRQRLQQRAGEINIPDLHVRASDWYEAHGLDLEAFHHATAAGDVARAARLVEGEGLPLYFRGEAIPVRQWFESLPEAEFKARPSLWVMYASVLTLTGRLQANIEEILQAAETALQEAPPDEKNRDLLGQVAAIRAMLAVPKSQVDEIITQSNRALELLHPDNAPMRTTTSWTLGYAYQLQGNRPEAGRMYAETIAHSRKSGNIMTEIAATTCVGQIRESENQAHQAAESFHRILELVGDPPWPAACEACVGLARIHYQWNDLDAAERFARQGLALAQQLENVDTPAACHVLLARVRMAQGDLPGALAALREAEQFVQDHQFSHWDGEIAAVRSLAHLQAGDLIAAARLVESHDLPLNRARIRLAHGDPDAALAQLEPVGRQSEEKDWADLRLKVAVLQALAHQAAGDPERALQALGVAQALAAPGGLLRVFVDEGEPMAALLREAAKQGNTQAYARKVLAAFGEKVASHTAGSQNLPEPLSERELEVLRMLPTELSGPEIARELMISLNTLRTHTKNIYAKLGANSRRAAVRRAGELELL